MNKTKTGYFKLVDIFAIFILKILLSILIIASSIEYLLKNSIYPQDLSLTIFNITISWIVLKTGLNLIKTSLKKLNKNIEEEEKWKHQQK